ncbi:AMP-dependent synthetase and ligase (plasmid) [Gemmatirosa kalamazoonensis]|uniref:AMP-dependent synthetase and ligase n=1 Tax=Gemmatirosa kalamazoonensis TaxID=861299 RepID=W0RML0_9BACT|nr:AMP-binding protein [Gemmatirosa kalamazoonensis]AHG92279.1 AMP-dependent synthetase and ligase [Gemmatirosa kalamazoonensis]
MSDAHEFLAARDFLLAHRERYDEAYATFRWPRLARFNWALDHFDAMARGNGRTALWIVRDDGDDVRLSFAELSARSDRVANALRALGARRGDRLLLMLPNVAPTWETLLACMKLGVVVVPATPQLGPTDLADRFARGGIRHVVTDADGAPKFDGLAGDYTRLVVGAERAGWTRYETAYDAPAALDPDGETRADDPLLLYFTSGTTAKPKLVLHTHASYPVGHLSTMYWIGLRADDVHWNISSPGWAKHAWSSVFAPWNAGATVFVYDYARFDARRVLDTIVGRGVTTLCAPPTVWRMLVGEDLGAYAVRLREAVSAGEPLNPEVIERVRHAWGLTIRDGYGQTETTAQVGNPPGQPVKPGSMGRPLPGYRVVLVDPDGREADVGEIALPLGDRPMGLMAGYLDASTTAQAMDGGYYRTGDVAERDADGYVTYVGRADDVFKSSDYRISPFELESALVEHPLVAEAAVVPSPDAMRLAVPKAFVALRGDARPSVDVAREIFRFVRERLPAYKRVRRLEFAELPKTISGKIRRVELRGLEERRHGGGTPADRAPGEHWEEDFPELRDGGTRDSGVGTRDSGLGTR